MTSFSLNVLQAPRRTCNDRDGATSELELEALVDLSVFRKIGKTVNHRIHDA